MGDKVFKLFYDPKSRKLGTLKVGKSLFLVSVSGEKDWNFSFIPEGIYSFSGFLEAPESNEMFKNAYGDFLFTFESTKSLSKIIIHGGKTGPRNRLYPTYVNAIRMTDEDMYSFLSKFVSGTEFMLYVFHQKHRFKSRLIKPKVLPKLHYLCIPREEGSFTPLKEVDDPYLLTAWLPYLKKIDFEDIVRPEI